MSVEAELRAEFDRWERTETVVFKLLPYALLATCLFIALLLPLWRVPVPLPTVIGLSVAVAAWMAWFHTLRPEGNGKGGYYAGLMALTACLVAVAPWYGLFTFVGYPQAFHYLKGHWRYAGVTVTSMISAMAYLGGLANARDLWPAWAGISVISTVLAAAFSRIAERADQRIVKQKQALAELHEANARLETALQENAGLQAQLLVQAREAGVLDERQRIARDIHDTLAQGLAGILTQLQAAEQTLGEHRHLANAMDLARESLTEARRTVHAVQPEALAEGRLQDAIGDVTRRWAEVNHVDAVLTTTGDPRPMHADVEVTLLRTAQEALANVAKHAKASRVGLTLSYMEDLVTLDVRDDGVGFEPDTRHTNGSAHGGFGLTGMRQRVRRLAGTLEIESEPGGGTAISAAVPAIPAGAER
ncbi:sensor histidine kinase [Amycolatopsis sp. NPDC089917]|uniref:sensor histidine kinase n=1 Tax=Amycolatopsis sp. NPDC089917 TaxID=3155187 RepID=UPI003438B519